jgi:hypothetical protein
MSNVIDVSEMFKQKIIQNNLGAMIKEVERIRLITLYVQTKYRYWKFKCYDQRDKRIKDEITKRINFPENYLHENYL